MVRGVGMISQLFLERDLQRYYPEQYARTVGIAEGAGVPLGNMLAGPAVEILLNQTSYVAPGACSAVLATRERSKSGEAIIAKNFDYPEFASEHYLIRHSRPIGLKEGLEFGAAPVSGSHEGVNEDGLAIAYNYGHFSGKTTARVAITNLVQELLERCSTVGEALSYLRRAPRTGGAILMLADASENGASVELAPDFMSVRMARDNGNTLAHTNHALCEEMKPRDLPEGAVLSNWYPKHMRGLPIQRSSTERYLRAEELMKQHSCLSDRDLIAMMADHNGGPGDDLSICRHGPFYQTTSSVVLYPKRRAMKVMFGAPCSDQYTEYTL